MVWLLRVLLLSLLSTVLYAIPTPPLLIESNEQIRLYNVRLVEEDGVWLIRGRVTRADRDQKVMAGRIVAVSQNGARPLAETAFKPQFVHRKTKRASYFTLQIRPEAVPHNSAIKLYFKPGKEPR